MSLQYYLSARLELALILGEKFRVKVAGKPTLDKPTRAGGGGGSKTRSNSADFHLGEACGQDDTATSKQVLAERITTWLNVFFVECKVLF
jgi:hypothetical protein